MPSIATWIRQCDEHWFTSIFSRYPHLKVHNARLHPVDLCQMDALILTGGGDISISFLCQSVAEPSLIIDTDCARDAWEFKAARELLSSGKPMPASRMIISSSYRTAMQFIPNSPIPPSGMISKTLLTCYCYSTLLWNCRTQSLGVICSKAV